MTATADSHLRDLARRLVWWQDADATLADERRFLAQAMTWANWEEMEFVRSVFGDAALRSVLENAPPGVFDGRSWNYWHARFGMLPPPPLPRRRI
jgi:hypothetical protein